MDRERRGGERRMPDGDLEISRGPMSLADFIRRYGRVVDEPYRNLKILDVNLMIEENSINHNTDKYNEDIDGDDRSKLRFVVRRGFPFLIKIALSQPFDIARDHLKFELKTGEGNPGNGTLVSLSLPSKPETQDKWLVEVQEVSENILTVGIHTPPNCVVSKWQLDVQIVEEKNGDEILHTNSEIFPIDFYILFNPWNKEDTVFLDNEAGIQEYILNDEGALYVGGTDYPKDWSFKQFDKNILECTMDLLDNSYLKMRSRGNSVLVSRALSHVGNTVLQGNWSGNYKDVEDAKAPTEWNGSAKIIQKYFNTKSIVKYGQCWVFSGILTTMCRAIGIPCRSVTNFSSAHDTDGSITIDVYYTILGVKLTDSDSIWNFHVWNEVWMDRPDLPKEKKYGGWQVIDCTPQEMNDRKYQCGPVSVAAIKAGDVGINYDGEFVFAEVNADRVVWMYDNNADKYLIDIETASIGENISTRGIPTESSGDDHIREDLTNSYKYKEGSQKEREAVNEAYKESKRTNFKLYTIPEKKSVKFFLERTEDDDYGKDFIVKLRARNTIEKPQSIYGHITIHSSDYTGKQINFLRTESFEEILEPKKEDKELQLRVTFEDYMGKLVDGCYVSAVCCFVTKETRQASITQDMIWLKKPRLHLKLSSRAIEKGEPFVVKMGFTNPLKIPLTNCYLDIEGSGIEAVDEKQLSDLPDVGPNERFVAQVEVKATKKGYRRINAVFNAAEMYGVSGATGFRVKVSSATPT